MDDLKLGMEQEIKEVRRMAAVSATLEEKLTHQKHQSNDLISQLEVQLQQQVQTHTLFTIAWELL